MFDVQKSATAPNEPEWPYRVAITLGMILVIVAVVLTIISGSDAVTAFAAFLGAAAIFIGVLLRGPKR